jgi:hypothetical protein
MFSLRIAPLPSGRRFVLLQLPVQETTFGASPAVSCAGGKTSGRCSALLDDA